MPHDSLIETREVLSSVLPKISVLRCAHCDEIVMSKFYNDEWDPDHRYPFCCLGCLTVFEVLKSKGLEEYYVIKKEAGIFRRRSPAEFRDTQYQFLDQQEFLSEYSYLSTNNSQTMEFYLEGIHCLACLWLIEQLPQILHEVIYAKLNMEKSVVTVSISPHGKFSSIAKELNSLGFRPHPLKKNQVSHKLKIQEERQTLMRIGIAAAGASNVMLYAISIYAGASERYAAVFNLLTIVFAIPVLSYSAYPFYVNAWLSLKNKLLSIDVPISLSLLLGSILGVMNLFRGISENYFDSLTTLVFLLLLSRYFLKNIQQKALMPQELNFFYQSESVLKQEQANSDKFVEIHPQYIKTDDVLKIPSGDYIPADGNLLQGQTYINMSLLTGESSPVLVNQGEAVFAGTQNCSNEILIKILKTQADTRIGKILKSVEHGWSSRAPVVELTQKVSKYFIATIFLLAIILFFTLYMQGNIKFAIEQTLTLLIVTCPCALALATPLAFTRALGLALDHGIIIKNETALQKITEIKNILLDKTGTITFGKVEVKKIDIVSTLPGNLNLYDCILSLEHQSRHPVAMSLTSYAKMKNAKLLSVDDYQEIPGIGVRGKIQGKTMEINQKGFLVDNQVVATFNFEDHLRLDSASSIQHLKDLGFHIALLTGDQNLKAQKIGREVGLSEKNIYANLAPEEKSHLVKHLPYSMMVGDGANDAIAFANAHVGVAVLGSMDIALKAADIYLVTPGLSSIEKLVILSKEVMNIIYRNLYLSLAYNALSVILVFMGLIGPLLAAIIMPISSLTVLFSTFYGTRTLRKLWK